MLSIAANNIRDGNSGYRLLLWQVVGISMTHKLRRARVGWSAPPVSN
jgi:hypothetical protein